ncbi:hypothetical protein BOTNAR_0070g00020 [Botryotinia narcissicola]|uniref:Uncharacterized protein n=1 Tax=Botryotinia narcissicola TaxID=278944 RepID=A0A4Z1J324_9HELO|nr:hypothetical protein BOTNAR_0070g00020 [Botryotinia narcissicola]
MNSQAFGNTKLRLNEHEFTPRWEGLAGAADCIRKGRLKLKYAYSQNAILRTLDRKVLDKGLQTQWKFFSEDDVMFGSLSIRGGHVAYDMLTWRKDISSSSPKDILNLKQCLAEKALSFWEKNPDPAWIPGAKEEQAFVEAYENMVKIIQGVPTEEADKYSAYMEHRLRLATPTDGGKTHGPLLHEVLSNKISNPGMRIAAELKFQAAQALHPERYAKLDANHHLDVDYSRKKEGRNSKVVTAKSLVGRSLALLVNKSLGKRKRISGDEEEDKHLTNKLPPGKRRKTFDPDGTRISARTSGLRTSQLCTFDTGNPNTRSSKSRALHDPPKFELSNFTTPLALLTNSNMRRKVTDESKG